MKKLLKDGFLDLCKPVSNVGNGSKVIECWRTSSAVHVLGIKVSNSCQFSFSALP